MRRGGFGAGALLSAALGAMLSGAVNATDLSSMPVVSGTLTISASGEYVVDGDVQCTTLAITAEGAVTFVNPSAGETNTIHVGSVTSVANASAAFDCKVAFDAAYNVVAEGPVTFAGGATATAPGTTSGAYGNVGLGAAGGRGIHRSVGIADYWSCRFRRKRIFHCNRIWRRCQVRISHTCKKWPSHHRVRRTRH